MFVGQCMRRLLVGLFGAPHCGQCDAHLNRCATRCALSASERKRRYIERGAWECEPAEARGR